MPEPLQSADSQDSLKEQLKTNWFRKVFGRPVWTRSAFYYFWTFFYLILCPVLHFNVHFIIIWLFLVHFLPYKAHCLLKPLYKYILLANLHVNIQKFKGWINYELYSAYIVLIRVHAIDNTFYQWFCKMAMECPESKFFVIK